MRSIAKQRVDLFIIAVRRTGRRQNRNALREEIEQVFVFIPNVLLWENETGMRS